MKNKKLFITILVIFMLCLGTISIISYAQGAENEIETPIEQKDEIDDGASELCTDDSIADIDIVADIAEGKTPDCTQTEQDAGETAENTVVYGTVDEIIGEMAENDQTEEILVAPSVEETDITGEQPQQPTVPTERKIEIITTKDTDVLQLGTKITLTAQIEGYDGVEYTLMWQCALADKDGNILSAWQDVCQDEPSYTYVLTEDNILYAWRIYISVAE